MSQVGFVSRAQRVSGGFWLLRPSHLARPWVWPCLFVSHTGRLCCPMKGRGKAAAETSVTRPPVFLFPFFAAWKIELLCVFALPFFFIINYLLIDRRLLELSGASVSDSVSAGLRRVFRLFGTQRFINNAAAAFLNCETKLILHP